MLSTLGAEALARSVRERAAALERPVAAFDADGTLWSGDVGEDLFFSALERADVRAPAATALREVARAHSLPDAGGGVAVARGLWEAYLRGAFAEQAVCEMMTWLFAGWSEGEMDAFAATVVAAASLPSRGQGEVLSVLAAAREAGVECFVVSASPLPIVRVGAALLGFDASHVLAGIPARAAGVLQADVERPFPYGAGKVAALRGRVGERPLAAAFGDSPSDADMLRQARVPVAVRPKPRLRAMGAEVRGLVELSPK